MSNHYCGETGNKKWMGASEPSLESMIHSSKKHCPSHHILKQHHAQGGMAAPQYAQGGGIAPSYCHGGYNRSRE